MSYETKPIFGGLRIFVLISLVVCFGLQMYDAFEKYITNKTTIASRMMQNNIFDFPTITLCLGFKSNIVQSDLLTLKNIKNWNQNQTLQAMNETFQRVTYDLKDVLVNITSGYDGNFELFKFKYNVQQDRNDDLPNEVLEVYSEQGRCYSIYNKVQNNTNTVVKMVMNITGGEVSGHLFYNRFGQQGLIDSYWPIETYPLVIKSGFDYIHTLQKAVLQKLNLKGSCIEEKEANQTNYNYLQCIEMYSINLLQSRLKEMGHTLCWIPQANFFIRQMNVSNIEACQTTKEMDDLNDALQYTMDKARKKDSGCIRPCTIPTIKTQFIQSMIPHVKGDPTATYSYLFFEWANDQILVEEEYLLMDTNGILADIGGSLGLFLGFSCLHFMEQILNKFELFVRKLKDKLW